MLFIKEYNLQQLQNWDEKLYSVGSEAGFCQSSCWARIIGKVDNARTIFLEVYNNNEMVLSLLLFHKIPWDREKQFTKKGIYEFLSGSYKGWLTWMDGPVIYTSDKLEVLESLRLILNWIDNYSKENHLYKIISLGFPSASKWTFNKDIQYLFHEFGYISELKATYLIDLLPAEKEIWSNLKNAARKSIKKARNLGCKVIKIKSLEEFRKKYYDQYVSMENSFGRKTNPWVSEEIQWKEGEQDYYHYYVAQSNEGEIVATLGMYIFNGMATEIASSMSKKAFEKKIPAQDLLHWEMILEAKNYRCHSFNLAGISINPKNHKELGIKQFKEKWGGVYTEYYIYHKAFSKLRSYVTRVLISLYHKFIKH